MRLLKYLTVLMLLASAKCVFSQSVYPSDTVSLSTNNIHLNLINGGYFLDHRNGQVPLRIKEGDDLIPGIRALSLWMIGLDDGGNLKGKAQKGFEDDTTSFITGPYLGYPPDMEIAQKFNRFWKINSADIGLFLDDYNQDGEINDPIPESVLAWPGNGNPFFETYNGFELPENPFGYAPFYDRNWDGIYNPEEGDFPCIGGDEAAWWMFNDYSLENPAGFPLNLGIEVKAEVSTFKHPGILGNTVFLDFMIMNKAITAADSLFLGLFIDGLLGCSSNNRVASIPEHDIMVIYNAVPDDEFCDETFSYEDHPGIIAIKTIKAPYQEDGSFSPMQSFMYLRSQSDTLVPNGAGWPENAWESYNYLNSIWKDGTGLYLGGDGYQLGTEIVNHAFNGTPLPGGNELWYDQEINSPVGIMSYGDLRMEPGETNRIVYAVSWISGEFDITNETHKNNLVDTMFQTYMYYLSGGDYDLDPHICIARPPVDVQNIQEEDEILLVPNPATNGVLIEMKNAESKIETIEVFELNGRSVNVWNNIDSHAFFLERNDLSAGLYILKATTVHGDTYIIKLIFQH